VSCFVLVCECRMCVCKGGAGGQNTPIGRTRIARTGGSMCTAEQTRLGAPRAARLLRHRRKASAPPRRLKGALPACPCTRPRSRAAAAAHGTQTAPRSQCGTRLRSPLRADVGLLSRRLALGAHHHRPPAAAGCVPRGQGGSERARPIGQGRLRCTPFARGPAHTLRGARSATLGARARDPISRPATAAGNGRARRRPCRRIHVLQHASGAHRWRSPGRCTAASGSPSQNSSCKRTIREIKNTADRTARCYVVPPSADL
jgi:hypothetical protein